MFVPLIVFVFVGLVLSAIIVNAAHAKLAASRTGSGLLGVSSLVSGIAATIFAVSLVAPRTSLADGEATDKGADAASSSATDPPPATPRVNANRHSVQVARCRRATVPRRRKTKTRNRSTRRRS